MGPEEGRPCSLYHNDNPPSASLQSKSPTIASVMPFAAVFSNLVMFDPAKVHGDRSTP